MPRALRSIAALVAAGALALTACTGTDDTGTDDTGTDDTGALPDGVAATVDGTEIPRADVIEVFDQVVATPVFSEQVADDAERVGALLRAQILSQFLITEIVVRGAADDFGIEITQADLDATLAGLEDDAGGPTEFDDQLEQIGLTRDVFVRMELPLSTLLQELEAEFGDLGDSPAASPDEMSDGQIALQEWGVAKFAAADVTVDAEFGTWNPETGEVEPGS